MKFESLARWATVLALVGAPFAASAEDQPGQQQPAPTENQNKPENAPPEQAPPPSAEGEQPEGMKPPAEAGKLTEADQQTLAYIHDVNVREIEAGKLAEKKATKPEIKSFARTLVKDHEQNNKELNKLAKDAGVKIGKYKPTGDADKQSMQDAKKEMSELKKAKGEKFDTMFLQMEVKDHEQAIAQVDASMDKVSPQVQAFLNETKPVLQKHEDMAKSLQASGAQARR